ncbi:MAG: hypothetical protein R6U84_06275 [Candidatus Cloacimonadales bacterium]
MTIRDKKDELKINFALIKVEKLKFFENDPNEIGFDEKSKDKINTAIHTELDVNIEAETIGIILEINFKSSNDNNIDLFGIKTRHLYKINNIKTVVKEIDKNNFNIPDRFLASLISIAYSGTRGMLVILNNNNKYKNLLLPLVQPTKLLPPKNPDYE